MKKIDSKVKMKRLKDEKIEVVIKKIIKYLIKLEKPYDLSDTGLSYGKETGNSYNMSGGYKLSSSVFRKIYNNGKEAILNINRLVKDVEKRIKNRQIKKQKKPENQRGER